MSGRKRILFLVPAFAGGAGGAERVISTLVRHFDPSRFECHLALAQEGTAFFSEMPSCVTLHELRVSRMRYALPRIVSLARKVRPHTIMSTVAYLNAMLIAAKPFLPRGVRVILREATTPSAFVETEAPHPRRWRWIYRRLYPRADKIVVLSDFIVEDMVLHFGVPREKLVRIYNPVDVKLLRQCAAAQPDPYAGSGPHLLAVGRLRKEKGVDLLLDAMPAVLRRFPQARLSLLGEGPEEQELKAQAARLGIERQVHFMGFQKNPWAYFSNADLFVLPSRLEGMPNALLEALALGTPALATDCPGGVREIQRAVRDIDLVPAGDADALAGGIISALSRRAGGRQEIHPALLEQFDPHKIADEYSRLF